MEAATGAPLQLRYAVTAAARAGAGTKRAADGSELVATTSGSYLAPFPRTHPSFASFARAQVAAGVKEDMCGLPLLRLTSDQLAGHLPVKGMPDSVELPDGTKVKLSPDLFRVPERLFDDAADDDADAPGPAKPFGASHVALHKMVRFSCGVCMHCVVGMRRARYHLVRRLNRKANSQPMLAP